MTWRDDVSDMGSAAVALRLGLEESRERFGPCPACGGEQLGKMDRRAPIQVYPSGVWWCSRCQAHGGPLQLAALVVLGHPKPVGADEWRAVSERLGVSDDWRPDTPRYKPVDPWRIRCVSALVEARLDFAAAGLPEDGAVDAARWRICTDVLARFDVDRWAWCADRWPEQWTAAKRWMCNEDPR